jgi:Na+-translocating ferredoxin:NAD+ oxidoreductase RnfG subunit
MRITLAASAFATTAVLAPTAAFAVDYLSAEQAATAMFPTADHFDSKAVTLTAAQMQHLSTQGVAARSASWQVRLARRGAETLGYVVVDSVVGKFELIDYAVGIATDGSVKQVEVLSYRESHGHEVRLPAWRKQFVGKTAASPIHIGDDIANISGATLSCNHLTDGVKRIVSVVDLARRVGALG